MEKGNHWPHVIKVYDIARQRGHAGAVVHTNIGYTHWMVADGLYSFLKAVGWKYIYYYPRLKSKVPVDNWME